MNNGRFQSSWWNAIVCGGAGIYIYLFISVVSITNSKTFSVFFTFYPRPSLSPCQLPPCGHNTLSPSLCPSLYIYRYSHHLSISNLQGNSNYLYTCVLHTINAAPWINTTLQVPCCVTDHTGTKNPADLPHANYTKQTNNSEYNTTSSWRVSLSFTHPPCQFFFLIPRLTCRQ